MKKTLRWLTVAVSLLIAGTLIAALTLAVAGMPFADEYAPYRSTHRDIATIKTDLRAASIWLTPTTADTVSVTCYDRSDNRTLTVREEEGVLSITEQPFEGDPHDIRRWINFTPMPEYEIEISIPADQPLALDLTTRSGDIVCYDLDLTAVTLISTSGDIKVDACTTAAPLLAETTSGSIDLVDSWIHADVSLIAASGDVTVDALNCGGDLSVEGSSGTLEFRDRTNVSGSVRVTRSSGDIEIDALDAGQSIELRTTTGRILTADRFTAPQIQCTTRSGLILLKAVDAESLRLESTSGDITLLSPHPRSDYFLNLHTLSGAFTLHNDTGPTADATRTLEGRTASGNITIFFVQDGQKKE